jgi:SAM-dependent methyltransferase
MTEPLHTLDPTSRFSDRARDYARFRPTYPREAIDAIIRSTEMSTRATEMSSSRCLQAADIGAGTGISSRLLASRGMHVTAVEPNPGMRAAAEPHPNIEWRNGTAEHTTLDPASQDLVLCAQAFHWFDAPKALAEFHRILRPQGVLCLLWNDRDNNDPLTAAYSDAIARASDNHPAARDRSDCGEVIDHTPLFTNSKLEVFPSEQPLTLEGLIGRALSASYAPKSGPKHDALIRDLTIAHTNHANAQGLVSMKFNTRLYCATTVL